MQEFTDIIIKNDIEYNKSLITPLFVFYTDDSDGIMMFWRNDVYKAPLRGYGAEEALFEAVIGDKYTWASESMKENIKLILEQNGGYAE